MTILKINVTLRNHAWSTYFVNSPYSLLSFNIAIYELKAIVACFLKCFPALFCCQNVELLFSFINFYSYESLINKCYLVYFVLLFMHRRLQFRVMFRLSTSLPPLLCSCIVLVLYDHNLYVVCI